MAFEDLRMQFAEYLSEAINEPKDLHELREFVRERINELRATGMPVPDDLLALERKLAAEE